MENKFELKNEFGQSCSNEKMEIDDNSSNGNNADLASKKATKNCAICGNYSKFKFYNAQSCEGCKQFFRRIIVKQVEFFCPMDGNCDFLQNKCRGCRLDKCLRMGMRPINVQTERNEFFDDFLARIERRREALLNVNEPKMQSSNGNKNDSKCDKIILRPIKNNLDWESFGYFCHLISAHNRIWGQFVDVPENYLNKFSKIEEVIEGPDSILCHSFSTHQNALHKQIPFQNDDEKLEKNFFVTNPKIRKAHGVFTLLMIGLLKAMPAFRKITFEDKLILAREVGHAVNFFAQAFNSAKIGAFEVMAPCGALSGPIISTYKNDPRIVNLVQKAFFHPLEPFLRIPLLEQGEYALLLAIIYSNPTINGLSECAKTVLEVEQSRYSRLFLKYLQMKLGAEKGARRYAECVQLIASTFQGVHNFFLMQTYIEVFHSGEDFNSGVYPECMKTLFR